MILILSVQDKQKGGINKKKKAPKPPLQIKLNHAPPVLQSSQPQPEVTSSVGSGFVVRVGHDVSKNKNQSSVKPDRKEKPVQEVLKFGDSRVILFLIVTPPGKYLVYW